MISYNMLLGKWMEAGSQNSTAMVGMIEKKERHQLIDDDEMRQ